MNISILCYLYVLVIHFFRCFASKSGRSGGQVALALLEIAIANRADQQPDGRSLCQFKRRTALAPILTLIFPFPIFFSDLFYIHNGQTRLLPLDHSWCYLLNLLICTITNGK